MIVEQNVMCPSVPILTPATYYAMCKARKLHHSGTKKNLAVRIIKYEVIIHPVEQPAQLNISCVSIPLAAVTNEEDDHLQVIINEMENETHLPTEDFDDYFAKL